MTQYSSRPEHTAVSSSIPALEEHNLPSCPLLGTGKMDPGVTLYQEGALFTLHAEHADGVELCLFREIDTQLTEERIPLHQTEEGHWSVFVADVQAGQRYGYRVRGDWNPNQGHYFNPQKLLVDPYTHAIDRSMRIYDTDRFVLGDLHQEGFVASTDDNADVAPKSVIIDDKAFDWGTSTKAEIDRGKRVFVELHPRGATQLLSAIPEDMRGTYRALAHPAFLEQIQGRCSSIQLVIQAAASEPFLLKQGKTNYWGYSPIGAYFAPDPEFAYAKDSPQAVVDEVKHLVKTYHDLGMEVFIDVIYNHTAEGGTPWEDPAFTLRAIDNRYYLTDEHGQSWDLTGCGNSIDMDFELSRALALDSLRYWRDEMQVDGIRYDLATVLGAKQKHFSSHAPFYVELNNDEHLNFNNVSESWGGYGYTSGYQVGNVPMDYEWNGPYQDIMRLFWGGLSSGEHQVGINEFSHAFTGSAGLFQARPYKDGASSVNYLVAHDGFTLRDLVTYNYKHNESNGEDNRDGKNENNSWNTGVEGESANPQVYSLRLKRVKAMMATLMLSQGTPMYSLGDLVLSTQHGNNNVYCQDNEISWVKWEQDPTRGQFSEYIKNLYQLRLSEPLLSRSSFDGSEAHIEWFHRNGHYMPMEEWQNKHTRSINAMLLPPEGLKQGNHGLYIAINASHHDMDLRLPEVTKSASYETVMCSSTEGAFRQNTTLEAGNFTLLPAMSVMVFRVRDLK